MSIHKPSGFSVDFALIDDNETSPYSIMEGAWLFAGIVKGLRNKIWEQPAVLNALTPLQHVWNNGGYINLTLDIDKQSQLYIVELTEKGHNLVKLQGLFEYEYSMLEQQISGDFKTNLEKYKNLRAGLATYAKLYLQSIMNGMQQLIASDDHILDFGGGDGYYIKELLTQNPTCKGVLMDKAPNRDWGLDPDVFDRLSVNTINFRTKPEFYKDYKNTFDVIIVSEVLHVMNKSDRLKAYQWFYEMLVEEGILIIVEQNMNFRLDWRLDCMTQGGSVTTILSLTDELWGEYDEYKFAGVPNTEIIRPTHFMIVFEKLN